MASGGSRASEWPTALRIDRSAFRRRGVASYVMGIPGLKICTAASPEAAYGLTKSMIRDNGPGILFLPVKMMKGTKRPVAVGECLPLNKAVLLEQASDAALAAGKAVTVLTYLHGVKEAQQAAEELREKHGIEIDLIELLSLKVRNRTAHDANAPSGGRSTRAARACDRPI